MNRKIVGICGFINSGKSTVANTLIDEHKFEKISFADKLKDGTSAVFGWDRHLLQGDTKESREWREIPDEFWSRELGKEITPRYILQIVGTECFRNGFHSDIWVLLVKRYMIEHSTINFVIPDVRFSNEKKMIRSLNGEVWRVKRGPDPDWIEKAISDNTNGTNLMLQHLDVHESERAWVDHESAFDQIISNDADLAALKTKISKLI